METQERTSEVAAAKAIATIAHRYQTDKIGVAYIEHPSRVAARLSDPSHVVAAWLHDVIEDCGVTDADLIAAGISQEVVDAVVLLTRTKENEGDGYYKRIRTNPIALAVKLADIADNTDEKRTERLDPPRSGRNWPQSTRMPGNFSKANPPVHSRDGLTCSGYPATEDSRTPSDFESARPVGHARGSFPEGRTPFAPALFPRY